MPKHFTTKATKEYKYKPRTRRYMIRKAKIKSHQMPLVFSGESAKRLERMIRVSGTHKKARGALDAPRYFWMTPANQPDKSRELLRFPLSEAEEASMKLHLFVTNKLNNVKDKKVVK